MKTLKMATVNGLLFGFNENDPLLLNYKQIDATLTATGETKKDSAGKKINVFHNLDTKEIYGCYKNNRLMLIGFRK